MNLGKLISGFISNLVLSILLEMKSLFSGFI